VMSIVGVPMLLGPICGPILGGWLIEHYSWHWIFLINVPIGIAGIALVTRFIENVRSETRDPFDFRGMMLAGAGVGGLAFGLSVLGLDYLPWPIVAALLVGGAAASAAYVVHARHTTAPVLDLTLFEVPTFHASVAGGFLFRLGVGALPFLLPLMLQVGFGMTAFVSGMVTCGGALGSFLMKMTTGPILRRFGFRRVLIGNTVISAVSLLVCAFFTAATPLALIFVLLLFGGFFRSLQYTCLNTLAFADIEADKMSAATSLASMMQQLSNGMGVAVGAVMLHATLAWRGAAPSALGVGDIRIAFAAVTVLCLTCLLFFLPLRPDSGAEVSGHGRRPGRSGPEAAAAE
jgi:MFS family permease